MVNNELLKFIKEQTLLKIPKEQIVAILKPGGWTPADVAEAFATLEKTEPRIPVLGATAGKPKRNIIIFGAVFFLLSLLVLAFWYLRR